MGDERMEMVYAKSARNALFATYLTLFVHPFFTDAYYTLDENWFIIMLASGLAVLIASLLIYYYKGD